MNKILYSITGFVLFNCFSVSPVVAEEDIVKIGIFPRRNAAVTVKIFKPIAKYLTQRTGRKFEIVTAKNFPVFWENVMSGGYDIVHYNQLHYIESNIKKGYQVIAQNEEFTSRNLRGAFVVRKDSGINSIHDLKGKKIIFGGGKKAFIAYMTNTITLRRAGLKSTDYLTRFAKNPPNASIAVYLKQGDAGGIGDIGLKIPFLKKKGVNVSELKLIGVSDPFPHLPWAVKKTMDENFRNTIQQLLINLGKKPLGKKILKEAGMTNINIAFDKDYDSSRALIDDFKKEY